MGGSSQNTNSQQNYAQNSAAQSYYGSNTGTTYGSNTGQTSQQTYTPSDLAQQYLNSGTSSAANGISQYMNPYQQDVINSTMAQLGQQFGQQQSQLVGNAASAGALGGDRQAIAQSSLAGQQGLTAGSVLAGLNSQNYNQALGASQSDLARQLQAAGMAGGTTSGVSNSSTLGQQLSSTLGEVQSNQATAGQGSGTSSTATDPGTLGIIGIIGSALGSMTPKMGGSKDGGSIQRYDSGGAVTPIQVDNGLSALMQLMSMQRANNPPVQQLDLQPRQTGNSQQPQHHDDQKSGSGIGSGLSAMNTKMFGTTSADGTTTTGWFGSGGLQNSLSNAGSSVGDSLSSTGSSAGEGASNAAAAMGDSASNAAAAAGDSASSLGAAAGEGMGSAGAAAGEGIGSAGAAAGEGMGSAGAAVGEGASGIGEGIGSLMSAIGALFAADGGRISRASGGSTGSTGSSSGGASSVTMPNISYSQVSMPDLYQYSSQNPASVSMPDLNRLYTSGKGSGGAVRGFADGGDSGLDLPGDQYLASQDPNQDAQTPSLLQSIQNWADPSQNGGLSVAQRSINWLDQQNGKPATYSDPSSEADKYAGAMDQTDTASAPTQPSQDGGLSLISRANAAPVSQGNSNPIKPDTGNDVGPGNALMSTDTELGITPSAFSGTDSTPSTGTQPLVGRRAVASTVAGELKNAGMSENGIRGIMANVKDESGFDPTLRHPDQPKWSGEAHYAHGLFQEGGQEWNNYNKWLEQNHTGADWRDPRLQTQFLAQNLKENYPAVWDKMNKGTPEEAAQAFASGYLKPRADLLQARNAQYGRGISSIEDFINGASGKVKEGISSFVDSAKQSGSGLLSGIIGGGSGTSGQGQPASGGKSSGLLHDLLNMNLSSPGLSDEGRQQLMNLSSIFTAASHGDPTSAIQNISNNDRQAKLDAMKLNIELAKLAQPQVMGVDGAGHKIMGQYDPETRSYKPIKIAGSQPDQKDMYSIPYETTGSDFVSEAKKLGTYTPQQIDLAQQAADYKIDPNKLMSIKGIDRTTVNNLAMRINHDYRPENYVGAAAATKAIDAGDTAKAIRSVGRLTDEVTQAHELVDKTHNSKYATVNEVSSALYPSGSEYGVAQKALGTALNNVYDTASAVAKGGGQGAEGDAKRRSENMLKADATPALHGALDVELEVGLKNGQTNLSSYNTAHGYTPDNPKYKTVLDYMTPAQRQKAIGRLGADKVGEITGRPVTGYGQSPSGNNTTSMPLRPANIPAGAGYSPSTGKWYDPVTHQEIGG